MPDTLNMLSSVGIVKALLTINNEDDLDSGLDASAERFIVLESIDSTNAEALRNAAGQESGTVWLAEQQTAGRGRRGKHWVSPKAANIALSMLWKTANPDLELGGLSLAVGVAMCDAMGALGLADAQLKWPNDILVHGRKLGGILLELQLLKNDQRAVVIGIGINVAIPAGESEAIEQDWTDLGRELKTVASRNIIAAHMITELEAMLQGFENGGFADIKQRWQALDAFAGEAVVVIAGDQQLSGIAAGVANDGALLLKTKAGLQQFHGGEVSLRCAPAGAD